MDNNMDNNYEVGYGKPPEEHQFKPGESGNKRGRPRGSKNTYTLLKEIIDQKIHLKENGQSLKVSKRAAILTQLVNKSVKGDIKAIAALLPHILITDSKEEDRNKIFAAMNMDDRAIINAVLSNYDGLETVVEGEEDIEAIDAQDAQEAEEIERSENCEDLELK
jgi:hypothetical protein